MSASGLSDTSRAAATALALGAADDRPGEVKRGRAAAAARQDEAS